MLSQLLHGGLDLSEFFVDLLKSLPGILLALSLHEAAHAYVAYRCGDSTAKMLGRMTINPIKHIDPLGFLMMIFAGVGWAKPVPVNPRNFKNYRRDDFLVSIAGIVANILQFLVGSILTYAILGYVFTRPDGLGAALGEKWIFDGEAMSLWKIVTVIPYSPIVAQMVVEPVLGRAASILFEMLANYTLINLSLALFNLLPIPPLDGYHVVNDLLLKRSLYASERASAIGRVVIYALAFSGYLSKGLGYVIGWVYGGVGAVAQQIFSLFIG